MKPTRFAVPVLIVIFGIILSAVSSWSIYKSEQSSILNEFIHDVDVRASALHREVVVNFEALQALAILFSNNEVPSKQQFSQEARKILTRHDNIQALEWIPYVKGNMRSEFERKMKSEYPFFEFVERLEHGEMVTAELRPEYFPVYYLEPLVGNENALGFDLASSTQRLNALHRSRDSGEPHASSSIKLVQEKSNQKGFLAFIPIYKDISVTTANRSKNLIGFVLGVFRIKDIFLSSSLTKIPIGITMTLVDRTKEGEPEILYHHNSRTKTPLYESIRYSTELPELWSRQWTLIATPTVSYVALRSTPMSVIVAVAGMLFSCGIALYIFILSNQTQKVRRLVAEKTQELTQANKKLALLSRTDGLTGVYNRWHMDELLDKEWKLAFRNQNTISLILFDIDHFKSYNDTYGHLQGDTCLKLVANAMQSVLSRPSDVLARYGGEEFVAILPNTDNPEIVAERCRQAIVELSISHLGSGSEDIVTISAGVCSLVPNKLQTSHDLIEGADQALYLAKSMGRNQAVLADEKKTSQLVRPVRRL